MSLIQQLDEYYGISSHIRMDDAIHENVPEADRRIIRALGVGFYIIMFLEWILVLVLSAGIA